MKRGDSGLSLVVGVNKQSGMTSHDVVNRCRRIFGEKRCGHTGTLDPLAAGVLPICVGPATRLAQYLTSDDKSYRAGIAFGTETETDDAEGEVTARASIPDFLRDPDFARERVSALVGEHLQVPPSYSAVKVGGKKSYEAARAGKGLELQPRRVRIFEAALKDIRETGGHVVWVVDLRVSKGTYIRSIARDFGRTLTCPAHVGFLTRTSSGRLALDECVELETLSELKDQAALDPVRLLGLRYAFADEVERYVASGNVLYEGQLALNEPLGDRLARQHCGCTSSVVPSPAPPADGETVSVIVANRLKALYRFRQDSATWKPECVLSTAVARG